MSLRWKWRFLMLDVAVYTMETVARIAGPEYVDLTQLGSLADRANALREEVEREG